MYRSNSDNEWMLNAMNNQSGHTRSPASAYRAHTQFSVWQRLIHQEEKSSNIISLLTILVTLLHVYGLMWLLAPEAQFTPPEPLPMEVSLISVAAPKPAAPPTPVVTPPLPKPVVKPIPKPVIKKPAPIVQKSPDYAPPSETPPPAPPAEASAPAASAATTSSAAATAFTEASFKANYLHNPKPEYPAIAKSRGWQGKVMLRVQVSAEGTALSVSVENSSGHEMLDESAIEAVTKWKFIPAKRGDTAVASAVIVPIVFTLRD